MRPRILAVIDPPNDAGAPEAGRQLFWLLAGMLDAAAKVIQQARRGGGDGLPPLVYTCRAPRSPYVFTRHPLARVRPASTDTARPRCKDDLDSDDDHPTSEEDWT